MTPTRRTMTPNRHRRRRLVLGPAVLTFAVLASLASALTGAGAQTVPQTQSGLSVTGFGQASVPAETATLQIQIGDPKAGAFAMATVSDPAFGGYAEAPVAGSTEV